MFNPPTLQSLGLGMDTQDHQHGFSAKLYGLRRETHAQILSNLQTLRIYKYPPFEKENEKNESEAKRTR